MGIPDSIIAWVIAAAAIELLPRPRADIMAPTLRTAGAAHAGGGLPSSNELNNWSIWYLTVALSSSSPCAACATEASDTVPCISPIKDSAEGIPLAASYSGVPSAT